MEIYKLSDKLVSNKEKNNDGDSGAVLIITKLKQGVKNENRVNVFVNESYAFSLDIAQVVDLKLKVGQELSEEKLLELKKASEFGKLYQRTLEWVMLRPRSERETFDYLRRKLKMSSSEDILKLSEHIIERLRTKGYLNDKKFAEWFVENRMVKKGVSKKRLEMELMKKGISREVISAVLEESGRDDEAEILKIIARKRAKYDDEKLIQYLCRQGFSYELVRGLVLNYEKD